MNADDLLPLLGKTATSAEIRKFLADVGAKAPTMKEDDIDAWVSIHALGIALVFQPEEGAPGETLQLIDIHLYPGGEDVFGPFEGALPHGLAFSDSREAARKKLGSPDGVEEELDNDAWDYDGYSLVLEYADARTAIAAVHLQMPYADDDGETDGAESSQRLL